MKVLDFGLAKAIEGDAASIDISTSPTMSRMATQAGVLLGTAAYMSPEQAKGKAVDRRADIWAFGCVLYEMLTGKMAFSGETVTDTLAAVIMKDPDWSQLPAATPIRVRVLLQRCLQKDPKQRLRDIGDARISLERSSRRRAGAIARWYCTRFTAPLAADDSRRRERLAIWCSNREPDSWSLKPSPSPQPVTRTVITLPPGQRLAGFGDLALAISPDGSQLAYVATTQGAGGETRRIYLRAMNSLEANAIPGTEGAVDPFFSPDANGWGFSPTAR